jgi:integrase/recombinase XerC
MNLEVLKNIDGDSLNKILQIAAILGDGRNCEIRCVELKQCTKEYISYTEKNRAGKTLEGVKLVCKHLLEFFPPNRDVKSIQLKDCEYFLDSLRKTAPKGVYNYLRALRAMWNKLLKWNYVTANPFTQVELPKRQLMKPAYLTEEMLYGILPHIDKEIIRDVVITTFYTGARRGEVVNFTWQDVILSKDIITIGSDRFQTKSRRQRVVPIHPKVKELLMKKVKSKKIKVKNNSADGDDVSVVQLPDKNGYVFCKSSGHCLTADYVSRQFKKACRLAGIDEAIHFHSIRHGSITRMIINGSNLPTVQRIAGHANIQTTMIYTHPDLENMREAIALL